MRSSIRPDPENAQRNAQCICWKRWTGQKAICQEELSMNGYPQELVDEAVDYVKRYHYIDDTQVRGEIMLRFHQGQKSAARLKQI